MKDILVIDDSIVARMLIKKIMLSLRPEWVISEANSGQTAIQLISSQSKFDIITVDYNMPDLNGIETAIKLKELQPHAKIFLLTANIQNSIKEQARNIQIDLIEKPLDEEKIGHLISQAEAS